MSRRLLAWLNRYWEWVVFAAVVVVVSLVLFDRFVFKGLIPIPGDIPIGVYYPWLDSDWGYVTGVRVKNPMMSDVVSVLYEWRLMAISLMRSGYAPLWDESSFLGMDLVGNFQAGAFNPFNVVYWLVGNFNYAWGVQVVLQPMIALVSMWLLLRAWGLSMWGRVMGAVAYGMSGVLIIWMEYNVHGFIMATYPLFVWLMLEVYGKRGWMRWGGLSLVSAIMLLYGYPQLLIYVALSVPILMWGFDEHVTWKSRGWGLVRVGLAGGLGAGLSGLQWWPGLVALSNSIRDLDVVALNNEVIYMPGSHLILALFPDFLGNPGTYNYWGKGTYESFHLYSSIVLLPLALLGLRGQKRRWVISVWGLAVLAGLMAVGSPVSRWAQTLSWLGLKGSVGARAWFLFSFSVAVSGAWGVDRLVSGKLKRWDWLMIGIVPVLVGLWGGWWYGGGRGYWSLGLFGEVREEAWRIGWRNMVWPALMLGLGVGGMLVAEMGRWRWKWLGSQKFRGLLVGCLVLLVVVDMGRFARKYLPMVPARDIFPSTPVLDWLSNRRDDGRIVVQRAALLPANMWMPYGVSSVSGYNILVSKQSIEYLSYLNYGKTDANYARFVEVNNYTSPLVAYASGRYALTLRDQTPGEFEQQRSLVAGKQLWKSVLVEGNVEVWENLAAVPLVYSGSKYVMRNDRGEVLASLSDEGARERVVWGEVELQSDIEACGLDIQRHDGQVYLIEAECNKQGIVVVNQTFAEGWRASIDRDEIVPMRVNGQFVGVVLPEGSSKVRVWYEPEGWRWGKWLSGISLGVWLVVMGWGWRASCLLNGNG